MEKAFLSIKMMMLVVEIMEIMRVRVMRRLMTKIIFSCSKAEKTEVMEETSLSIIMMMTMLIYIMMKCMYVCRPLKVEIYRSTVSTDGFHTKSIIEQQS